MKRNQKGFTLIELLIVIGIIAILAAAVIITITPGERLKDARESTRRSHMAAIGTAFHMAVVENDSYTKVSDILGANGCDGDDGDGDPVVAFGTYRNFNDACAALIGLGSAPLDPKGGFYQVKATADTVSGRLMIDVPTASDSDSDIGVLTY